MDHDAIIVGGGFAGLSAATYLARGRRSVAVIDSGRPRNRFADEAHGFLGRDGSDPRTILNAAQRQLEAYPGAARIEGQAVAARAEEGGFAVDLAGGEILRARKLVLAFGLSDTLPSLPGIEERWGKTVLHCPYCHGIEFSDLPLGVLYRSPMSVHQAMLIAEWGPTTLYLNGEPLLDAESSSKLSDRGIRIEEAPILALEGEGPSLSGLSLAGGRRSEINALYVAPHSCLNSPLGEQLGCVIDEGPLGPIIRTDGDRMTTVPGVYAAGDIARAPHSVSWAVADGVTAGTAAHRALVFG
jgi:thioredoxin reductase